MVDPLRVRWLGRVRYREALAVQTALFEQMQREVENYGIDSWKWYCHTDPGRSGNGFRLDEAFLHPSLAARLCDVRHEWGTEEGVTGRRDALSDHAALIVDFAGR